MIYGLIGLIIGYAIYFYIKARATQARNQQSQQSSAQASNIVQLMNEIDRAILSNASFEQVASLLCTQLHQFISYEWVTITPFEANAYPPTTLTMPDGQTSKLSIVLESALKSKLDEQPNGLLLENIETFHSLKPLHYLRSKSMMLMPIYRDAELSGLMGLGFSEISQINPNITLLAKYFTDRLGVALTSVFRTKQLFYQEHYDALTGLPNRRSCHQRLSLELSRARRNQLHLAVLYISLDGFKKVNDIAGYVGGDAVLLQVADRLRTHLREPDVVSRFGSDEFVVVLTDIAGPKNASKAAEKILEMIAQDISYESHRFYLSASIGISMFPHDGQTVELLLQQADIAMNRIKRKTTGSFIFYEEDMNSAMIERLRIEQDLRQALSNNEIFLMYQPQLDLRTKIISGVEALLRWKHPTRGVVSPLKFIEIAEQSDLIEQLGYFARKHACEQLVKWKNAGVIVPKLALNVSSKELKRKSFETDFTDMLDAVGVHASSVELEITESLFIEEGELLSLMLKRLRNIGVQIAIDDFGTGYSNLSYLSQLPFDVLKIDRAFVSAIGKPSDSHEIVSLMLNIAHHFGKTVCAEGVETRVQWEFLKEKGCENIQGFLFSEPLSAEAFEKLCRENQATPFKLT